MARTIVEAQTDSPQSVSVSREMYVSDIIGENRGAGSITFVADTTTALQHSVMISGDDGVTWQDSGDEITAAAPVLTVEYGRGVLVSVVEDASPEVFLGNIFVG